MTPEQLEAHPSSKVWYDPSPIPQLERSVILKPDPSHLFWITSDLGVKRRAYWSEEGKVVYLDA